jgi:vitamin B12 transporter
MSTQRLLLRRFCLVPIVIAVVFALLGSAPSDADTSTDSSSTASASAAADLQQIVISATRTPEPLDQTGSSMSVISGAELATQQVLVVSDALEQVPGVSVTRTGGPGQDTSMYVRGADPGQSLVLIDGIRINDPSTTDGEPVLGDLFVNNVERIEVLRGPQSTLYGSDAIGGVINLVTQLGGTQPLQSQLNAEGGTFDTYRVNGSARGTDGALSYGLGVNYFVTRGKSAADARDDNVEPYGNHNLSAMANFHLAASDTISVDLRGFYIESRTDDSDYVPPSFTLIDTPEYARDSLLAGYLGVNGTWFDGHLSQRLALVGSDSDRRYYGSYNDFTNAYSPVESFFAHGGSTRAEYQGVVAVDSADALTYGAETQLSTLNTYSIYDITPGPTIGHDRLTGYFAQWQSTIARQLTLSAGVRRDDQQISGNTIQSASIPGVALAQLPGITERHTSVRFTGAWRLNDGATVLRANYGDGFKAPTLYQLYSDYSNPLVALQPETAKGWEFGVDQLLVQQMLRASLSYFRRDTNEEIEFDDCFVSDPGCTLRPEGYYYNVGRASARGTEAELVAQPTAALRAWINYTNLTARDELTGLELARRPHISGDAGLSWSLHGNSIGFSYLYVGQRYDDVANTVPLAANERLNLFGSYAVSALVRLYARVENIFDNENPPAAGYAALGRAFYLGMQLRP